MPSETGNIAMDDDLIEARNRVANQKRWGRHPLDAILSGQWDNGSIIQNALKEVQNEKSSKRQSD